jgi:hypothetical protein
VFEVNTDYMLRMSSDENGILALNFDKDTILGDKKDFHKYDKYIVNFKIGIRFCHVIILKLLLILLIPYRQMDLFIKT